MSHRRPIAMPAWVLLSGLLAPLMLMADSPSGLTKSTIAATGLVADSELSTQRGRYRPDIVQLSAQELDAVLTDNSAMATINGPNTVSSQAFANSQGHLSVIQNSGNNVIIQDTTIYNITFIN
ncbi:MAG: hypothetical protein ACFCVA_14965 [Gammaproteobacteria bacterium]